MPSLRKWVRDKLGSQSRHSKGAPKHHRPPLPLLPTSRRPLTPTTQETNHLRNYGLFTRVPYEVRHQILVAAFGERRLHMHLSYNHPLTRLPRAARTSQRPRHCGLDTELILDTPQQQQWHWFSCVCHRRAGYSEAEKKQRFENMEISQTIEPCDDQCLRGSEEMCSCAADESCFIGVMGWLLACRQAYADGIDVLYGANSVHISNLALQLNLPRLVPGHHLERIKSLELLWELNDIRPRVPRELRTEDHVKPLWDAYSDGKPPPDSSLHQLCGVIPQAFPRLRRLYIGLQCWMNSGAGKVIDRGEPDLISVTETMILGPIEDMLRAISRTGQRDGGDLELNVAVQVGAWHVLSVKYHTLLGAKLRAESADGLVRGRFWKPLDDNGLGYWICSGWEDVKLFPHDYWVMMGWGDKWTGVKDTF